MSILTLLLLLVLQGEVSHWDSFRNWVGPISGFLLIVAVITAAVVIIMSRRKEEAQKADKERADALEKLLKTVEAERDKAKKDHEALKNDFDLLSSEHRTLVGIDLEILFRKWATLGEKDVEFEEMLYTVNKYKRLLERHFIDPNENLPAPKRDQK